MLSTDSKTALKLSAIVCATVCVLFAIMASCAKEGFRYYDGEPILPSNPVKEGGR